MKKIFLALFSLVLLFSLLGCKKDKSNGQGSSTGDETHVHTFVKHDAVLSTYYDAGNYEYYTCSGCSSLFDSNQTVITQIPVEPVKNIVADVNASYITKYGNVYINLEKEEILEHFSFGDVLKVEFLDKSLTMPLVSQYSDVANNEIAILSRTQSSDSYVMLCLNGGNFATTYNIATQNTETKAWTLNNNLETFYVTISISQKNGYLEEFLARNIKYTNNREDYSKLTDEEYANFREIKTENIGSGILFRGSSPINPDINRNNYADYYTRLYGVKSIINLADSKEVALEYLDFNDTYYSKQKVLYLNMTGFTLESVEEAFKVIIPFMADNDGPYLIHCKEGKDRAGVICAILELYMGETYDNVCKDYMKSFENFSYITTTSGAYSYLLADFNKVMDSLGIKSTQDATDFIDGLGLARVDINKVTEKLNTSYENIRIENFKDLNEVVSIMGKDIKITYGTDLKNEIEEFYQLIVSEINAGEITVKELKELVKEYKEYMYYLNTEENYATVLADFYNDPDYYTLLDEIKEYENTFASTYDTLDLEIGKSKYKLAYFSDMTASEIEAYLNGIDPEKNELLNSYKSNMSGALTSYYTGEADWYEAMQVYFNNAYLAAKAMGYDSGLDYLYYEEHKRKFSVSDTKEFMELAAEYALPLYRAVGKEYQDIYASLTDEERHEYEELLNISIVGSMDLLDEYYKFMGTEMYSVYNNLYKTGNYFFSNISNSNASCWSSSYGLPMIFISDYGQNLPTFVHEFGHYYNGVICGCDETDIAEVHSQGNEALMYAYLQQKSDYSENVTKLFTYQNMLGQMINVFYGCQINEIEIYLYSHPDFTATDLENIIASVGDKYGFRLTTDYIQTICTGWNGYYISYAVSSMASLELYSLAMEDIESAVEAYQYICHHKNNFLTVIEESGLESVFSENAFTNLYQAFTGHSMVFIEGTDASYASNSYDDLFYCLDCELFFDITLNELTDDDLDSENMLKISKTSSMEEAIENAKNGSVSYYNTDVDVYDLYLDLQTYQYYLDKTKELIQKEKITIEELSERLSYLQALQNALTHNYVALTIDASILNDLSLYDMADLCSYTYNVVYYSTVDVYKQIYKSSLKSQWYEGYTDEELEAYFNSFSEDKNEMSNLENKLNLLLSEYNHGKDLYEVMAEFVPTAQELATLAGYDTYLDYLYKESYGRDYTTSQVSSITTYVKNYIVPIIAKMDSIFNTTTLTAEEKKLYHSWNEESFLFFKDYIDNYTTLMGGSYLEEYNELMTNGKFYLTDVENPYVTAFSWNYPNGDLLLFFGNGYYQSSSVFIHEFGHHHGKVLYNLDLDEVHSQGNEALFYAYLLDNYSDSKGTILSLLEKFNYVVSSIPVGLSIALLEQDFYNGNITSEEELDQSLATVNENVGSTTTKKYFLEATLNSIGYYYSYAVSAVSAMELFALAINDFEAAHTAYEHLCDFDSSTLTSFESVLAAAGLGSPFEESTYQYIYNTIMSFLNSLSI